MQSAILVLHLMVAIAMIGIVLLQRSEGGALGIGGGGGGGGGLGGMMSGRGASGALVRTTVILGSVFFLTSIFLSVTGDGGGGSVLDSITIDGAEISLPLGDERGGLPETAPVPAEPEGPAVPLSE